MKIRGFLSVLVVSILFFVCTGYAIPFSQVMKYERNYTISSVRVMDKTHTFSKYPALVQAILWKFLVGRSDSPLRISKALAILRNLLVYSEAPNSNVTASLQPTAKGYLLNVVIYRSHQMRVTSQHHYGHQDALVNKQLSHMVQDNQFDPYKAEKYYLLANMVPGVNASYYLNAVGTQHKQVQLITLQHLRRFYWDMSLNNSGNKETGPYLFNIRAAVNHLFGNDQLVAGFGFSNKASRTKLLSVAYRRVLNQYGTELRLHFINNWSKSQVFTDEYQFNFTGQSYSASVFQPLYLSATKQLGLNVGYSYINGFNNGISQGTFQDLNVTEQIPFLFARLNFNYFETVGHLFAWTELAQGVDLGGQHQKVSGRPAARNPNNDANLDFTRFNATLAQQFNLPRQFGLRLSGKLQLAGDAPLPISQKFTFLDGAYAGQGFVGDDGAALNAELQYNWLTNLSRLSKVQFYGFGAIAWLRNPEEVVITYKNKTVETAGLGVRLLISRYLTGYFELAKPFDNLPVNGGQSCRALFGLNLGHFE